MKELKGKSERGQGLIKEDVMDVIEKMVQMVREGRIDEILAEARNRNRLAQDFLAEEEEGREDRDTWLRDPNKTLCWRRAAAPRRPRPCSRLGRGRRVLLGSLSVPGNRQSAGVIMRALIAPQLSSWTAVVSPCSAPR